MPSLQQTINSYPAKLRSKTHRTKRTNNLVLFSFARAGIKKLEMLFESTIEVSRIKVGKKQSVETLINEEALLFAKFLSNENEKWNSRKVDLN
jgi:hypothetical protein